jgi:ribosomal protein S18 acetylase RimI-like enzyme
MAELCGGAFQDQSGLLMYHTAVPDPVVWNGAIVTTPKPVEPTELVTLADSFFASYTDSYGFWILASRDGELAGFLTDNGSDQIDDAPHMVIECADAQPPASSVTVQLVTDQSALRAFVDVAAAGFETIGADPRVWPAVYPTLAAVCAEDVMAVVAWENGRPLGAAMGYLAGEVCEVIHVATAPAARRRGIGTAVTAGVVTEARARGATLAVLQSTEDGHGVYSAFGFEEVDRYRLHLRTVPHSEAQL